MQILILILLKINTVARYQHTKQQEIQRLNVIDMDKKQQLINAHPTEQLPNMTNMEEKLGVINNKFFNICYKIKV